MDIIFCAFSVRFFDGIVELAVHTASTADPQSLALHYYESGQPEQPGPPYDAFLKRYAPFAIFLIMNSCTGLNCLLYFSFQDKYFMPYSTEEKHTPSIDIFQK